MAGLRPPTRGRRVRTLLLLPLWLASLGQPQDDGLEDSCPAGPAGAACRRSAGHEWKVVAGCAIPAGNDIGGPEFLTVEAAQQRCGAEERCQGFTFEGADPEGPLAAGGALWVHLKDAFDCVEADWVSYRKMPVRGRGASAPAPPPPPPPPPRVVIGDEETQLAVPHSAASGVALCLAGQLRMLASTHLALEQHLLSVLRPDVFVYGPREPGANEDSGPELYGVRDYVVDERYELEDIRSHLYSQTSQSGRVIDLEYLEVQGNWFGNQCLSPPLRDNRPGSAICMYYNQQKCLDMVREQERKRGRTYEYVVISRFDFRWLAPHPPLDLLRGQDAVWIPSGSDWEGGTNDRHAAMPRRHADAYLSAWRLITEGSAKDVMLDTLGSMKVNGYPGPNTECFLKARLLYHNVSVERFPSVAYLTCTQRVKSRWTQCYGTASNDAPGWLYKEEMEHATRIAQCVRSAWSARKLDDCREDISHLYRGIR